MIEQEQMTSVPAEAEAVAEVSAPTDQEKSQEVAKDKLVAELTGKATAESVAKPVVRRTRDNIAIIVATVLAIILWMVVKNMQADNFEMKISGVAVEVRGVEQIAYSAIETDVTKVDVVLRGRRAAVEVLTAKDIKAFVDVSSVKAAGETSFVIQFEGLPTGVSVVEQSTKDLVIYMDKDVTVSLPLSLSLKEYRVDEGSTVGKPTAEMPNIEVKGPQQVLARVVRVEIAFSVGHLQQSAVSRVDTRTATVRFFSGTGAEVDNPYLSVVPTELSVSIPLYVTKQITLAIANPSDFAGVEIAPTAVKVTGKAEDVAKIGVLCLGTYESGELSCQMEVVLPEGVSFAKEEPHTVTVRVTPKS